MKAAAGGLTRGLQNRVVVVTGGAVRLGRATVKACAELGANVVFAWSSSGAEAKSLERELRPVVKRHGTSALSVKCNVTREADVDSLFARVDEVFGRVDMLVNNAAIFRRTPITEITLRDWQEHLDVNLTGSFLCAQRAGLRMARADGGVIVNVACAGGLRPWPSHVAYCVSKAGVVMLTQVLARALAPKVRVNAVVPGPVLLPESYDDAERKRAVSATVLGRLGSPDDVVRAVLFCWESDYTTGALIPVEGGRLLV